MAYATRFAFDHVWSLYHETQKQIRAGNLSMLPQVKAIIIFCHIKIVVERHKDQPFDLLFEVFLFINICVSRIISQNCERFEPKSHFKSRLSMIIQVNVVLNRTVIVGSD